MCAVVAGVGHFPGRDLQRREQAGGAVADVVVGGLLRQPGPHRQHRRGAVQRLHLRFLVDADHDRVLAAGSNTTRQRHGPSRPTRGSVENLNVSRRHGCSFQSRQIRATDANEIPRCLPSSRADQCVTPNDSGGALHRRHHHRDIVDHRRTTGTIQITQRRIPPASYRLRHRITVGRDTPTRRAISAFGNPWPPATRSAPAAPTPPPPSAHAPAPSASTHHQHAAPRAAATDMPHCPETTP